ncbi:MAG: hypothetical protein LUH11_04055 [Candidatus Gastranaerophilales bacterium]|nr:hypothetical protein [Candidatus Gastranaerophilales bacterium]
MCIAIVKPQGTTISDKYLENCFENNNDGAGIAYSKDGKLFIIKGIFDEAKFIKIVRNAEKLAQGDMLIHCRISTSGLTDKNNCHPHIVNNNLVMIHNGILNIEVPKNSIVSDTVIFIENYLKYLKKDFVKDNAIMKLIETFIGKSNKFAFLNNNGESFICNKDAGIIENGIWYSNDSFSYNFLDFYLDDSFETYQYFKDMISDLDYEELYKLGDSPLINIDDYQIEPFSIEKYKNTDTYISLKNYSKELYSKYISMYDELIKLLNNKTA